MSKAVKYEGRLKLGVKGLLMLNESKYFWSFGAQETIVKIFELLGIEEKKEPVRERSVKVKARNRN